jgi:hypothetical protein
MRLVGILLALLGLLFVASLMLSCGSDSWGMLCEPDDLAPYIDALKAGGPGG